MCALVEEFGRKMAVFRAFFDYMGARESQVRRGEAGGVQGKSGWSRWKMFTLVHIAFLRVMLPEVVTVKDWGDDGRCRTNPHIPPHVNYFGGAVRQGPQGFPAASCIYPYTSRHGIREQHCLFLNFK